MLLPEVSPNRLRHVKWAHHLDSFKSHLLPLIFIFPANGQMGCCDRFAPTKANTEKSSHSYRRRRGRNICKCLICKWYLNMSGDRLKNGS